MNKEYLYTWAISDPQSVPIEAYAELCRLLEFKFSAPLRPTEFAELRAGAEELGITFESIERICCESEPVR